MGGVQQPMHSLWVGLGEAEGFLLAPSAAGLNCQHFDRLTGEDPLVLPVMPEAPFHAAFFMDRLYIAAEDSSGMVSVFVRGQDGWRQFTLALDGSGTVKAIQLLPANGGLHLFLMLQEARTAALWQCTLDPEGKELGRVLIDNTVGTSPETGLTVAGSPLGGMALFYRSAAGGNRWLFRCGDTAPEEWIITGTPALLAQDDTLHIAWLEPQENSFRLLYQRKNIHREEPGLAPDILELAKVEKPGRGPALAGFKENLIVFWEDAGTWRWRGLNGSCQAEPKPLKHISPMLLAAVNGGHRLVTQWSNLALLLPNPPRLVTQADLVKPIEITESCTSAAPEPPESGASQASGLTSKRNTHGNPGRPPSSGEAAAQKPAGANMTELLQKLLDNRGMPPDLRRYQAMLRSIQSQLNLVKQRQESLRNQKKQMEAELDRLNDMVTYLENKLIAQFRRLGG